MAAPNDFDPLSREWGHRDTARLQRSMTCQICLRAHPRGECPVPGTLEHRMKELVMPRTHPPVNEKLRDGTRFTLKPMDALTSVFLLREALWYVQSLEFPAPRVRDCGIHKPEACPVATVEFSDQSFILTSRMVGGEFIWESERLVSVGERGD